MRCGALSDGITDEFKRMKMSEPWRRRGINTVSVHDALCTVGRGGNKVEVEVEVEGTVCPSATEK